MRFPEACGCQSRANALKEPGFEINIIEEPPARPRVDDADFIFSDAETLFGCLPIATNDYNRSRAHVLLFANHLSRA